MKQDELIKITALSLNCESALVEQVVDVFIDTIISSLKEQDRVELRTDFGSFVVRLKGGTSRTEGAPITKVERIVSFKATPTLKKHLKQSDKNYLEELQRQGATIQIDRMRHRRT